MKTQSVSLFVIAALAAGVMVLGYLYYQERQDNVNIKLKLPGVEIEQSN